MGKIVVTGMGAVTPLGIGVPVFWDNLIQGKCGVAKLTRINTDDLLVKIGAEVKDFNPEDYIPKRVIRELDLFMQYAYAAAEEALADSKLEIEPRRVGIVMATAMNGIGCIADTQMQMLESAKHNVSPRFVPKILGNVCAAQISIAHNIQGPSLTVSTACSSGGDGIMTGQMLLKSGMCDAVLVVGGEATLSPIVLQSLAGAHALSRNNDNPEKASRPFDVHRDGFVMGEGGGAILLETEAHAKARGAVIHCELAGCANNTDAHHVTAPHPDGIGASECMRIALETAGMKPEEIGYINMHGTSTGAGDVAETKAIHSVFGDLVSDLCVSSTKGATGHMMGAGGVVETITAIMAVKTGVIPPTINLEEQDPQCDLDYVANVARKKDISSAMSNAFGFGGQNSCVIVKKY